MSKTKSSRIRAMAMCVVFAIVAAGCYTYVAVNYDPGKTFANEWYAGIPLEEGHVTSCTYTTAPNIEGKANICRSVWGVEGAGDPGNWHVDPGGSGNISNEGILSQAGTSSSSRGVTLVMEDGKIFEGCQWRSPDNTWFCDYQSRMWTAPFGTTQGYNYLRATIDWGNYAIDTLACAGALTGTLMYGQAWTLLKLSDCGKGPL